jgi:hypothetical protein
MPHTSTTILQTQQNIDSLLDGRITGRNVGHEGRTLFLFGAGKGLFDGFHDGDVGRGGGVEGREGRQGKRTRRRGGRDEKEVEEVNWI